jgi:allophanate hydrolase subunit 2
VLVPAYPEVLELPLVTGYEFSEFDPAEQHRVFDGFWTVSSNSDRTATLLDGAGLPSGPSVLDSVPLVDGTVQVLASGRLLVFMRDRPTIGGYPKLGAVLPEALDRLAQARPGTRVRFVRVPAPALRPGTAEGTGD